jgi:hypothetical protein
MSEALHHDAAFAGECRALADEVETATRKFGQMRDADGQPFWAYEVDGYGNQLFIDDANAPGLLSLAYLGCCDRRDPLFLRTRQLAWSERNPYFFKGRAAGDYAGESPVEAIERALAAALVSYYPIAGRLAANDAGELVVDCTGEGVWFVEATACCTLEEVDYLEYPLMVPKDELLPHPTYPADDPLAEDSLILLVQVI